MTELLVQSLLALAAGALLNLTPCVLPAIPLKISAILREAGAAPRQRLLAAASLLAGSLTFFLALGGAAAYLRLSWGFLFQSDGFLVLLVLFLVVAGLVTLFDLSLPLPQVLLQMRGRRYLEPFLTGALAAVLSTPCTGPFLGGVLVFAMTRPPPVILLLFALIGVGLALPYLIIILRPGLLERMPRGGQWSVFLKEFLGLTLLAGALFFAQSLLPGDWGHAAGLAWSAALGLWAILALVRAKDWPGRIVPATLAAVGIFLVAFWSASPEGSSLAWESYSDEVLEAARSDNRPVLIEFTADWCINCKVLEKTVYVDTRVIRAAAAFPLVALRIDLTEPEESFLGKLADYGGAGLPFAVVLDGRGAIVERLPDLFTAEALATAIRTAGKMR